MSDPYVYPGSDILKNRFGIKEDACLKEMEDALAIMTGRAWDNLSLDEKVDCLSKDMAAIWKIHGFREGNTRTTVIFYCDYADSKGFPLNRQLLEKNSVYVRTALVAASARFSDIGDLSNLQYLKKIIKEGMLQGAEKLKTESPQAEEHLKAPPRRKRHDIDLER